ncbi:MAG: outer membrane beta-barrel protein, partial [Cytophagales bacterium]|nr:outer membrane beta-barrel protein [Cytophagales bacterium]
MKKALLFAGLLATQFAAAQQKTTSLELGLHAGTSLSSLLDAKSPFATLHPRPGVQVGFTTGISAQYRFSRHFSVHTGLAYEEKGARVKASS